MCSGGARKGDMHWPLCWPHGPRDGDSPGGLGSWLGTGGPRANSSETQKVQPWGQTELRDQDLVTANGADCKASQSDLAGLSEGVPSGGRGLLPTFTAGEGLPRPASYWALFPRRRSPLSRTGTALTLGCRKCSDQATCLSSAALRLGLGGQRDQCWCRKSRPWGPALSHRPHVALSKSVGVSQDRGFCPREARA